MMSPKLPETPVSKNLVSRWEQGVEKSAGPAKPPLAIVEKRGLAAPVA
jgi:DNA-binding transcriptional regulator YiaG